jgi:hypothetical protein
MNKKIPFRAVPPGPPPLGQPRASATPQAAEVAPEAYPTRLARAPLMPVPAGAPGRVCGEEQREQRGAKGRSLGCENAKDAKGRKRGRI